ncbi:hypothetical protein JT318_gp03 [Pseudomonas phage PspYZU01]|uniref:Uncharacterized protein n=1 Tax=Pseudomonas phage PspYZU01 TaxID=1983555 RepID=A0A2U7NLM6_9CAUD|nr:hypothetical protein JT318_gp03 [Pseudomonas phage PspYZU01]ASD51888.1 hypothetical protein PspYZU01_03 [Pseudomonas phage PspYZU01]
MTYYREVAPNPAAVTYARIVLGTMKLAALATVALVAGLVLINL